MVVISLKDYAAQKNISYEAVRQQVVRYKEELEGHIIRDGRQQFLDEEAVAFLDARRMKNPVAIIQQSKDDAIEQLEREKEVLLEKVAVQADKISELAQWKADNALAIAEANQTRRMLEDAEKDKQLLEGFIANAKAEIAVLSGDRAKAEEKARTASTAAQTAQNKLAAAQERERVREEREHLMTQYAAELAEWSSLGWFGKRRTPKPMPPELPELPELPKEDDHEENHFEQ